MITLRVLALVGLSALAGTAAGAQSVAALPAGAVLPVGAATPGVAAVAAALPVGPVALGGILSDIFGLSVGLDRLEAHVKKNSFGFGEDFKRWGSAIYMTLFALQFLLIGATMLIRGPFALGSTNATAFGPFANFFFFLIAGAFGYLLVSNSYYLIGSGPDDPDAVAGGWLPWFFNLFEDAGKATGCDSTGDVFGVVDPCNADKLAAIGMRMSGVIMALAPSGGTGGGSTVNRLFSAAGASSGVFGAFSVLAIQMSITRIAFQLAIVTAPFFLATIIFKPISGIATGFINFVLYLGVKLFVLYLVAGLASFLAIEWLEATGLMVLTALASGIPGIGDVIGSASKIFSFNMSVLTMSLLFLGLTLYLPTKIAGQISGALHLDLNALLFRGELPVQMD